MNTAKLVKTGSVIFTSKTTARLDRRVKISMNLDASNRLQGFPRTGKHQAAVVVLSNLLLNRKRGDKVGFRPGAF